MNRYGTFLTLLERFKNHVFYERKRMKKLALFLTDYLFFSKQVSTRFNCEKIMNDKENTHLTCRFIVSCTF
jgi:hypothetical protein